MCYMWSGYRKLPPQPRFFLPTSADFEPSTGVLIATSKLPTAIMQASFGTLVIFAEKKVLWGKFL